MKIDPLSLSTMRNSSGFLQTDKTSTENIYKIRYQCPNCVGGIKLNHGPFFIEIECDDCDKGIIWK